GQKYVIHNIIFIAKKGYVPPPAATPESETDTADSEPVTETEAEESSSGAEETVSSGCRASAGLPAALFAGAAAVLSGKRRGKKRNGSKVL
ncbi:MAG: hypothetical protein J6V01_01935, partial [Clostridia bacterium]|nr:hypothetical protein [Clostridia bacterium]